MSPWIAPARLIGGAGGRTRRIRCDWRILPATLLLLLATLNLGSLPAGDPSELPTEFPRPVMHAYLSHEALPAGSTGTLLITLEVAPAFHIQINDFIEVLLPEGAPLSLGKWTATRTETHAEMDVLRGKTAIKLPFTVAPEAAIGVVELTAKFGFQGCAEEPVFACFPPDEMEFPIRFEILAPGGAPRLAHEAVFSAHGGRIDAGAKAPAGTPGSTASGADAGQPGGAEGSAEAQGASGPAGEAGTPSGASGEPGAGSGAGLTESGAPTQAETAGSGEATVAKTDLAGRLQQALSKRSFLAFLIVFLSGILTSFTPCVYPMIPITISYVGGRAASHVQGFFLSLFFVLGIAIMYSALGVVAASTGSVFGSAMQSPAVLVFVAAVFLAMGASMLGAFNLTIPSALQGKLTEGAQRGGIIGAILMGMVTGLVASPCVGPVLLVLLTFVAQTGSILFGFWLLFTFACGLGVLFLVLGTFAGAIRALPGAGSWMDTVKHAFGVVLIGVAIYYVRTLIGPAATGLIAGAYMLFIGVFTGAFTPLPAEPGKAQLMRKSIGLLLFLAGAVIFVIWLLALTGMPALLAHGPSLAGPGRPGSSPAGIPWRVNDEAALAQARAEGRPVVQDFYADWCAACVELDEKTWIDPEVIAEAKRFMPVKMDFTRRGEFYKAASARYEIRGMPTVIFYDASGKETARFFGFKKAQDVLAIMRGVR
jgi:thiol:disulfide interchange protein DsbD